MRLYKNCLPLDNTDATASPTTLRRHCSTRLRMSRHRRWQGRLVLTPPAIVTPPLSDAGLPPVFLGDLRLGRGLNLASARAASCGVSSRFSPPAPAYSLLLFGSQAASGGEQLRCQSIVSRRTYRTSSSHLLVVALLARQHRREEESIGSSQDRDERDPYYCELYVFRSPGQGERTHGDDGRHVQHRQCRYQSPIASARRMILEEHSESPKKGKELLTVHEGQRRI